MAQTNLPSPSKVSGKHNAIYEAYYLGLDTKRLGTIEALVAAKFLKKSGLSDVVLSRIWDLSDPTGRGFLDREGFFVALKLVALAQAGHDIHMRNIFVEPPNPPKVGEVPKLPAPKITTVVPHTQDWQVASADRLKYGALFDSLLPGADGLLPGNKVRSVLMDSKLPLDALSRIWDLADQDKDGSLDRHEFLVAMHLVYMALDRKVIPSSLPIELHRPKQMAGDGNGFVANFPSDIAPPPVPPLPQAAAAHHSHIPPLIPPMPMRPAPMSQHQPTVAAAPLIPTDLLIQTGVPQPQPAASDWVVSPMDKQRFDVMFKRSDLDNDGLVSGLEIKDVFLQSGIPQLCLAQIWALCDTAQSGKLTAEQFALAMWMVERKRMGYEPPECLTPQMVPPSQRPPQQQQQQSQAALLMGGAADLVGLDAGGLMQPTQTAAAAEQAYANPELAMIAKEIEELVRERRQLETEVTQREADIRIKNGEVRSLQSELDTLAATLKQLENQKGEAQKRLDDLKAQTVDYEREREVLNEQLRLASEQVNKIRDKCQKQEDTIRDMEGEVDSKRGELQKLKDEESSLEREYDSNKAELDKVSQHLQDTKLQISQIKSMVTQLQENQRQMSDALAICKSAIETNNPTLVSDYTLRLEPEFREVKIALEKKVEKPAELDTASSEAAFKSNGFTPSDPFGASSASTAGGFATTFDDSFGGGGVGFGQQTRSSDDAFGGAASGAGASHQLGADPFGDKSGAKAVTPDPNKDDFGSDPFAILHAPTSASQIISPGAKLSAGGAPPRPESPSPALPPKQAKKPPPRPAPPRPTMGPTPTRPEPPSHGFGGSGASGGFADFANFDDIPSTPYQANPTTTTTTTNITTFDKQQPSAAAPKASNPIATPVAAATTDFVEDPFKDYRYEDPFNIKDPFDDDDDAITDNFASIIAVAPSPITTTASNTATITATTNNNAAPIVPPSSSSVTLPPAPTSSSSATGTLPKHASPAPTAAAQRLSPSFANFNNQFGASSSATRSSDFFDAFHDNFNRNIGLSGSASSINAAAATTVNNNSNSNSSQSNGTTTASASSIDLAFGGSADFDPFGVPPSKSNAGTLQKPPSKVDNAFAASFNADFFGGGGGGNGNGNGFEDEFAVQVKVPNASANQPAATTTASSRSSNSNNSNNSDFAKFDAFSGGNNNGFGSATAAADPFGEARFDANFGANFTQKASGSGGGGATRKTNNTNVVNNNLTAAAATIAAASGGGGVAGDKLKNPRYASDYSQGEAAFDKDLQEALQRSMVDQ